MGSAIIKTYLYLQGHLEDLLGHQLQNPQLSLSVQGLQVHLLYLNLLSSQAIPETQFIK
jgi:hypothetical protein